MKAQPDYVHAPCPCPCCGETLSASSAMDGPAKPAPYDLSVCIYCGAILVFEPAMTLRAATPELLATYDPALRRRIERMAALARSARRDPNRALREAIARAIEDQG